MVDTNDDGLRELILNDRASGLNWYDIQRKHGIEPVQAKQIYNEALSAVASDNPTEYRMLMQVRLEKVVNLLWEGLEQGSFKNGDTILKAIERISELMDLNQETIKHQITLITDEQALQVFEVLNKFAQNLRGRVQRLDLPERALLELDAWPEWSAEAATEAVEAVLVMEDD